MIIMIHEGVEIAYYKYKSDSNPITDCIKEYPLTQEIIQHVIDEGFELEMIDDEPKRINGYGVFLI